MYHSKKRQRDLLFDIERLEKKKNHLERQIEELKENPKAIEKKAREELWLMDPDEIVIVKEKDK